MDGNRGVRARSPEALEWDLFEAYFIPTPIAQQGVQTVGQLDLEPRRIVDLGAGAGVLAMVARQRWPNAIILAVEPRASELRHLRQHADDVLVQTLADAAPRVRAFRPQLVLSNPPFTLTASFLAFMWLLRAWAIFFLRQSYGDNLEAYDWLDLHPASLDLQIGGRPNLRPEGSFSAAGNEHHGDSMGHRWLVWSPGAPRRDYVPRLPLPRLPSTLLSWTERPGTEPAPPPPLPPELLGRLPLRRRDLDAAVCGVGRG